MGWRIKSTLSKEKGIIKMNKLSKEVFEKSKEYILNHGREIDQKYYLFKLDKSNEEDFLEEIKKYQNEDGGFGHGIESDFWMPQSTPMATTVGFQYLDKISFEKSKLAAKKAINYLEKTYNIDRNGWFAANSKINDYPHAPWWSYDEVKDRTPIDEFWGNPSAEIIGYLYKHKEFLKNLDIDKLIDKAVTNIKEKKEFKSFHEIYCYISLYKNVDDEIKRKIKDKITQAVTELVETDRNKWLEYTPKPLDFISNPEMEKFGIKDKHINENLDYLIEILENSGRVNPNWEWGTYPDAWEKAKENWTVLLTVKAHILLDKFGRIEKF